MMTTSDWQLLSVRISCLSSGCDISSLSLEAAASCSIALTELCCCCRQPVMSWAATFERSSYSTPAMASAPRMEN